MTVAAVPVCTLRSIPVRHAADLLAGRRPRLSTGLVFDPDYPTADTLDALAMLTAAHEAMSGRPVVEAPRWWISYVVVEGVVVGDVGFHGPPPAEPPYAVEIGYQIVPAWRGRGLATRATGLLLAQAWTDGADLVSADVEPDNTASLRVLAHHGFRRRDDGVFELTPPRPSG
ncbi:MAG TPA: GNAT family protein [Propionibacteriaceae bacterium]